ncbi:MAG: winged helix-turn-helix transcriptional regulator [Armatimonadetes bacterium]|nr:winged helix-turn-helix transcriptional regulator [Armatimonadota bacterium]
MSTEKRSNATPAEDPLEAETLFASLRSVAPDLGLFEEQREKAGTRFASELMTALGHPTRLRIVVALRRRPLTVSHLASLLGVSQANTSQHLGVLLRAGALVRETEGAARRYSLRGPQIGRVLDLVEGFWESHREDIAAEHVG